MWRRCIKSLLRVIQFSGVFSLELVMNERVMKQARSELSMSEDGGACMDSLLVCF